MKKLGAVFSLVLFFFLSAFPSAAYQQTAPVQPAKPVEQMVAMRDGVKLATLICLPEGNGPWPVVLMRTPYIKEVFASGGQAWTRNGYAFVVQDSRGKGKSEGR